MSAADVSVTMPYHDQAIVLFLGDGAPIVLGDEVSPTDLPDLIPAHPVARAVLISRLRGWADLIEGVQP